MHIRRIHAHEKFHATNASISFQTLPTCYSLPDFHLLGMDNVINKECLIAPRKAL